MDLEQQLDIVQLMMQLKQFDDAVNEATLDMRNNKEELQN